VSDESGNKVTKAFAVLESAEAAEAVLRFIENAVK